MQKTLHPADDPACHAIIVHPPGGIVGGDRLEISALAEAGSHALADDSRRHTLSIADTKLMLLMGRLMAT